MSELHICPISNIGQLIYLFHFFFLLIFVPFFSSFLWLFFSNFTVLSLVFFFLYFFLVFFIFTVGVIDLVVYIYIYVGLGAQSENRSPRTGILSWKSKLVNKKMGFGHKSPRRWSEEECLLGWAKQRSECVVCHPGQCFGRFYW